MKNSCLKSKNSGGCPEPEMSKNATLLKLITNYIKVGRPRLKGRLFAFKKESFKVALKKAALAKEISENDHRFIHLHRLKVSALKKASQKLLKEKQPLLKCKQFDGVFKIVSDVVATVSGIGPMYAYDVALRIAANRRLKPKKVYLQRGVRTGAENLLGRKFKEQILECSVFPAVLRRLTPMEIEDFLCIYKKHLKHIKR
jgi:hypothetical protein